MLSSSAYSGYLFLVCRERSGHVSSQWYRKVEWKVEFYISQTHLTLSCF